MNLELLLTEAAAGFGTGVLLGVRFDRKYNFVLEFDKAHSEIGGKLAINEGAEKQISLLPLGSSMMMGGLAGLVNLPQGPTIALEGISISMISTYAGFKAGEYASRFLRKKTRLNDSEQAELDGIFDDLKQNAMNDESFSEPSQRLNSFFTRAIQRSRNPDICKEIYNRIEGLNTEVTAWRDARALKNFLQLTEMAGVGSCTINPDLKGVPYVVILHEGKGYQTMISISHEPGVGEYEGFFAGRGRVEEAFSWDNKPETLLQIINERYRDKPVILVSGCSEAPLEMKGMCSVQAFAQDYKQKKKLEKLN